MDERSGLGGTRSGDSPTSLWMYWEDVPGHHRPPYIDLCMETIMRHAAGFDAKLLDRQSVGQWLPDLDVTVWDRLPSPVHRADYARTRLLHRHGGLWLDVDCIALRALDGLPVPSSGDQVVGWGRELDRFYNGLFACAPGSSFVGRWIELQDEQLCRSPDWAALARSALGQDVVRPLARALDWHSLPMEEVAPIPWYEWRRLLSRLESPDRALRSHPVTLMLWNASLAPLLEKRTLEETLGGCSLLSRLLRIGLGISTVEEEDRGLARLDPVSRLRFSYSGRALELRARSLPLWQRASAPRGDPE